MKDIHILFVDDEPDILKALERLMSRQNFAVHFAGSGADALDMMASTTIHIVITDLKMPGMDGLSLLRQVRVRYPEMVRLALSAYLQIDQLLHCINTGEIFRYITKPANPEELNQAIQDAVDYFLVRKDRTSLVHELLDKNNELQQVNENLRQEMLERRRVEAVLRESEERYRMVANFTYNWEYWLSPDKRFNYCSPACERITGYRAEEFEKDPDLMTAIIHPDDFAQFVDHMDGGVIIHPELHEQEFRIFSRSGEVRWIAHACRTVHDSNGTFLGRRASNRDITQRKRIEEEKSRLEAQFIQAQKMESVGRLAGGVAHDFNNMLGIILGHAELALDQVDPSQHLYADLEEIRIAANRSADLTRQLLTFARKQTIAPRVLDLNETVEGMLRMLRRLIGEDIELPWLPGKNLWLVKVDPSQIDQILANLCVNGRDAISGVGKITIETGNSILDAEYCASHPGSAPGEYVRLAASDTGCGMEKETIDKIFEPFFTTKEMGKGTGLGLATVYGIVKQNNGFIDVNSELEQGTTFTIYLPRHMDKSEKVQKHTPAVTVSHGHETVLLVEDEQVILNMTTIMLERMGYTVLAANTPGEAIRMAEAFPGEIHLIMTDVVMPEMNGRDLTGKLSKLYPNLTCLFTSGYTADIIARHGVLDPGGNFIQKPFSLKDLAAKVRELLPNKGRIIMENRETGGIGFTCGHWPLDPEKPTLIFIHGAGSNNAFWNPQIMFFSENVNAVALDLPGHGASPGPGKEKISEYADAVLNFVDQIQAPRPVPCGLSMGGAITQQLLVSHPDRFPAGILINTGTRLKVLPIIFETIENNYDDFITMLFSFAISPKSDAEKLRTEIITSTICPPAVVSGDFRACNAFNASDALGSIKVPVLVLTASDDRLTPVKYGAFLANSIKQAELITIEDAGHFSNLEKPLEVNQAINDFLIRTLP